VRDHDHKLFRCELPFNGESYGWEAQYLEGGELLFNHALFSTKAAAVQWAEQMRPTVEKGEE
jgi:hypothetical protein